MSTISYLKKYKKTCFYNYFPSSRNIIDIKKYVLFLIKKIYLQIEYFQ